MKQVIINNFTGFVLLFSAAVFMILGSHLGIDKLTEFGVGVGAAALYSFRAHKEEDSSDKEGK